MSGGQAGISVLEPVSPALERVKEILFRPFDLGRWFVIGFCAWLAYLSRGGGGASFPGGGRDEHNGGREVLEGIQGFVASDVVWFVPAVVFGVLLVVGLWVLVLWLSSRGHFMFLHCVVEGKAEVKVPWRKYRAHGNSLFLFRLVLWLLSVVAIGVPGVFFVIGMMAVSQWAVPSAAAIAAVVIFGVVVLGVIVLAAAVSKLTVDFVAPIMLLGEASSTAAWRQLLELISRAKLEFVLYLLFQVMVELVIGVLIMMVVCGTCCCAACVLAIPYIGTVAFLPVLVFKRSYPLYYLRQYGRQFDVFASRQGQILEGQVVG